MKKFIRYVSIFIFPLLLILVICELLIREIPNDYIVKKKYLEKNVSDIKILCLGSSHGYYDLNPSYFKENCYNAAYVSQPVNYDYKIYQKYNQQLISLKWIILPVSYFTFFSKIETSPESWRIKDYSIYSGLNGRYGQFMHYEMLTYGLSINLKRIFHYYSDKANSDLTCSDLGFGIKFGTIKKKNLDSTGYTAALRHTKSLDKAYYEYNKKIVEDLILLARGHGVKIIIFIPPAWHTYVENMDKNFLNMALNTVDAICRKYPNVICLNYLNDNSFQYADYYDADHLNIKGSIKLSTRIDSLINVQD